MKTKEEFKENLKKGFRFRFDPSLKIILEKRNEEIELIVLKYKKIPMNMRMELIKEIKNE